MEATGEQIKDFKNVERKIPVLVLSRRAGMNDRSGMNDRLCLLHFTVLLRTKVRSDGKH